MSKRKPGKQITLEQISRQFSMDNLSFLNNKLMVFRFTADEFLSYGDDFLESQNHRTDFFSIIHVSTGSFNCKIDYKDYAVNEPSIVITSPASQREIISLSKDAAGSGILFTLEFLKEVRVVENIDNLVEFFFSGLSPRWVLDEQQDRLIYDLLTRLLDRFNNVQSHRSGKELLILTFLEFLIELVEVGRSSNNQVYLQYGRREEMVAKFGNLAKKHHLEERNLSFYADRLFVTSKHLSETVKEITGRTAGQLLDDMDIMEAKRLLENLEVPVSEVAHQLNFSSPAFFTKFFHRMEGMSPRSFRKLRIIEPSKSVKR